MCTSCWSLLPKVGIKMKVRSNYTRINKTHCVCFICHDDKISIILVGNTSGLLRKVSASRSYIFKMQPQVC